MQPEGYGPSLCPVIQSAKTFTHPVLHLLLRLGGWWRGVEGCGREGWDSQLPGTSWVGWVGVPLGHYLFE